MTPFDWLQIEAAASGHSNPLREWPFLVSALRKVGHEPENLDAPAWTVRDLCRALIAEHDLSEGVSPAL